MGANHPNWSGGARTKICQHCGSEFSLLSNRTVTTFRRQKFCSKECADKGGLRYFGEANGNWNGNPRRRHRESKHAAWARAVISRDNAACQACGAKGVELHAHHIRSYKNAPELRWDVSNGTTLCYACHWKEHSALDANGVNSGEAAAGSAGGHPEPSVGRKPVEGVTTRGRAYRRWEGSCEWCGAFISRRWSDVKGKSHHFCSKVCAGKFKAATRTYRVWKDAPQPYGSNASTSALRESDEIV
jgi:5-methylcytosine-specific restriction endonuclease McrA